MKKKIKYTDGPDEEARPIADFLPSPKDMQRKNEQAKGAFSPIHENETNDTHLKMAAKAARRKK